MDSTEDTAEMKDKKRKTGRDMRSKEMETEKDCSKDKVDRGGLEEEDLDQREEAHPNQKKSNLVHSRD